MPRALRIEYPGAIYDVMNRGDLDHKRFLARNTSNRRNNARAGCEWTGDSENWAFPKTARHTGSPGLMWPTGSRIIPNNPTTNPTSSCVRSKERLLHAGKKNAPGLETTPRVTNY